MMSQGSELEPVVELPITKVTPRVQAALGSIPEQWSVSSKNLIPNEEPPRVLRTLKKKKSFFQDTPSH